MNLLAKLKDPNTNWKYILLAVVLVFIVAVAISGLQWIPRKEVEVPKLQQTEISALKTAVAEDDILPIFLTIFPTGITNTHLDQIADIDERARVYLRTPKPPEFYLWDTAAWGVVEKVELDGKPNVELFVIHAQEERSEGMRPAMPTVGPIYVFRWDGERWDLIGEIPDYTSRSWYTIGEMEFSRLADIMIGSPAGGGKFSAARYEYNDNKYSLAEKIVCYDVEARQPELCEEVWTAFEKRIK